MRCRKVLVLIRKSLQEEIPQDVYAHEVKILQGIHGDNVRVVGWVLDEHGKPVSGECGSPVDELDRLRKAYTWMDANRTVNAAEAAFANSPQILAEAMKVGLTDEDLDMMGGVATADNVPGVGALDGGRSGATRDALVTKAELCHALETLGVEHDPKSKRFVLFNAARDAIELRAEDVDVDTGRAQTERDLIDLIPQIAAAREAAAGKAGVGAGI